MAVLDRNSAAAVQDATSAALRPKLDVKAAITELTVLTGVGQLLMLRHRPPPQPMIMISQESATRCADPTARLEHQCMLTLTLMTSFGSTVQQVQQLPALSWRRTTRSGSRSWRMRPWRRYPALASGNTRCRITSSFRRHSGKRRASSVMGGTQSLSGVLCSAARNVTSKSNKVIYGFIERNKTC